MDIAHYNPKRVVSSLEEFKASLKNPKSGNIFASTFRVNLENIHLGYSPTTELRFTQFLSNSLFKYQSKIVMQF